MGRVVAVLVLARVVAVLVLALAAASPVPASASAAAPSQARKAVADTLTSGAATSAAACSNATVALPLGKVTLRFVLHGHVTCKEAHRTMRSYARALGAGRCPTRICTQVVFSGGWTCSSSSSVEEQESGALAGCERSNASFNVHKARHQRPATGFATSVKGGWIECRLGPRKALRCQATATASGGNEPLVQVAQLARDGHLASCSEHLSGPRCLGRDFSGPSPSFPAGRHARVGAFACTRLKTGVRCTVARTGTGFRITPHDVKAVER